MNKKLTLAILIALCYFVWALPVKAQWYVEVGVGKNGIVNSNEWKGRESTGARFGFGYVWEYQNLDIDLGYQHYSQWTRGDGFDDREEDTLDAVYITLRRYF